MQTLIHVHCKPGPSLRDRIARDRRLEDNGLFVVKQQQPGRSPGWLKIRSTEHHGALNVQWDASGAALRCRVVTRGAGKPGKVVGAFVEYVLRRHRSRVRAITILPG